MVKSKAKSGLSKKLGSAGEKAFNTHKSTEIELVGGGGLPGGIENGIARLVECKFDQFKKGNNEGEYYFSASGVVVEPHKVGKIPIQGLRTQIGPEPLCDTPTRSRKTLDEHIKWVLNEMKKLGADVSDVEYEELEDVAEALKEAGPHFRFRTWQGEKQTSGPYKDREPTVQHQWSGMLEFDEEDEEDVEDDTESDDEEDDEVEDEASDDEEDDEAEKDEEEEEEEPSKDSAESEVDLDALAASADEDEDEDAAEELSKLAIEAGIEEDKISNAPSWAEVAEYIRDAEDGSSEKSSTPEKGDIYFYKPPRMKKSVEHEVTFVSPKKKTVNLKDLNKGNVRKGIAWSDLQTSS